jgi:hypothetical protein
MISFYFDGSWLALPIDRGPYSFASSLFSDFAIDNYFIGIL